MTRRSGRDRAAQIDAAYAAYDLHPLAEPDDWGDLASFRETRGSPTRIRVFERQRPRVGAAVESRMQQGGRRTNAQAEVEALIERLLEPGERTRRQQIIATLAVPVALFCKLSNPRGSSE